MNWPVLAHRLLFNRGPARKGMKEVQAGGRTTSPHNKRIEQIARGWHALRLCEGRASSPSAARLPASAFGPCSLFIRALYGRSALSRSHGAAWEAQEFGAPGTRRSYPRFLNPRREEGSAWRARSWTPLDKKGALLRSLRALCPGQEARRKSGVATPVEEKRRPALAAWLRPIQSLRLPHKMVREWRANRKKEE